MSRSRRPSARSPAFSGRNGVGKTSLLRAIVGHQPVTAGSVDFEGEALGKLADLRARPARHRLCAAGARDLSVVDREGKSGNRVCAAASRTAPGRRRDFRPVSGPETRCCPGAAATSPAVSSSSSRSPAPSSPSRSSWCSTSPPKASSLRSSRTSSRVIALLRDRGDMAILLVEQYYEFARDLADRFAVMDRGEDRHVRKPRSNDRRRCPPLPRRLGRQRPTAGLGPRHTTSCQGPRAVSRSAFKCAAANDGAGRSLSVWQRQGAFSESVRRWTARGRLDQSCWRHHRCGLLSADDSLR